MLSGIVVTAVLSATAASALTYQNVSEGYSPADKTCDYLYRTFPDITSFSNQSAYIVDNTNFWSAASVLNPACVFAPSAAEDLAIAVKALKYHGSPFAIRGGGHMPIGDSNNINSTGVLLSSSGFKRLALSPDSSTLHVGPGNHWGDVYNFLNNTGKSVVGGRLGVVGIPGFITGGGISFFSWKYGWSSANIASVTGVIASGEVVTATPDNDFSDLFWALRGGGNSFALITEFEMITIPAPVVTVGTTSYGSTNLTKKRWLDAIYNFALYGGEDCHECTVTPSASTGTQYPNGTTYTAMKFFDGNDTAPPALSNWTSPYLNATSDTFAATTMTEWSQSGLAQFDSIHGLRNRFHVLSTYADRRALQTIHDSFFAFVPVHLSSLQTYIATLTPMPITKQYFRASKVRGGNPMDLDPEDGPHIWYEMSVLYTVERDEEYVSAFLQTVDEEVKKMLAAEGIKQPKYLYLNDADKEQPVFEGYPAENVRKLKQIRHKYDPEMVFTNQMPGGWKVAHA
ncbi:FAD binding domain-containing protein [Aureobasidium pullulans]|uniref:FAD binding domain-containing protein n=1 Tax=Aureobasidium pullulans TaxID=5580 RepID=A0A4S9M0A6_AURPU|nr:FAD binding domain-containing protein [Aureobasidium pullulans]